MVTAKSQYFQSQGGAVADSASGGGAAAGGAATGGGNDCGAVAADAGVLGPQTPT